MKTVEPTSLHSVIDSISERLFYGDPIAQSERATSAFWLAGRQGLPGSYANMFAPTNQDVRGVTLFTGEPLRSRVGITHILGEECCRILALLKVDHPIVQSALSRAVQGFVARLEESESKGYPVGTYCCGTCSAAYWRNLALRQFPRAEERIQLGLAELKRLRTGDGRWRRFPFYYTCLVLNEIGAELAKVELQYAAPYWRRNLNRLCRSESPLDKRRAAVGRRLLELCEH